MYILFFFFVVFRICLYVDENLEAEKNNCALHKYKHEKERVLVGSDPFPKELQKNDMLIKELVYIPNVISISNENFVAGKMCYGEDNFNQEP